MKSGHIAVGLAALIIVAGLGHAFLSQQDAALAESKATATTNDKPSEFVHVDELAKDANGYQGEIVLRAVVAKINNIEGVVSVIDSREFESCGQLNCAANYLPVRISGALPEPRAVLLITGQVVRSKQGLVFEAAEVKKVQ